MRTFHSSFSKIKSISCVCPVPRCLELLEVLRAMLAERADEGGRQGVAFVYIAADFADIAMLFFFALRNIYSPDSRIYVKLKNTVN